MLLKISLIIAILAGAGVLAVTELQVKKKFEDAKNEKIKLEGDLSSERAAKDKVIRAKSAVDAELATVKTDRDKANDEKKVAQEDAKKAEDAKVAAEAAADAAKKETLAVRANFKELDELGMKAPEIKAKLAELVRRKEELETANSERVILGQAYAKLKGQWDQRNFPAQTPPPIQGVKGKILAVDPKWQFVVVDVGLNQGVLPNGECLVVRGGKVIARIKMATVEPDQSIANVMRDVKLKVDGEILEGDVVVGQ